MSAILETLVTFNNNRSKDILVVCLSFGYRKPVLLLILFFFFLPVLGRKGKRERITSYRTFLYPTNNHHALVDELSG
jgi:hypothetical protein